MGADYQQLRCFFPMEYRNKTLQWFKNWKIRCPDYDTTTRNYSYILTGIVIVFMSGLAITIIILMFRKRGFSFCGIKKTSTFSKAVYKRAPPFEYDI